MIELHISFVSTFCADRMMGTLHGTWGLARFGYHSVRPG